MEVRDHNVIAYVHLNNILYKVPSVLAALDICFQTHQVFHLKYSFESENIYLFIQIAIYNITTMGCQNPLHFGHCT